MIYKPIRENTTIEEEHLLDKLRMEDGKILTIRTIPIDAIIPAAIGAFAMLAIRSAVTEADIPYVGEAAAIVCVACIFCIIGACMTKKLAVTRNSVKFKADDGLYYEVQTSAIRDAEDLTGCYDIDVPEGHCHTQIIELQAVSSGIRVKSGVGREDEAYSDNRDYVTKLRIQGYHLSDKEFRTLLEVFLGIAGVNEVVSRQNVKNFVWKPSVFQEIWISAKRRASLRTR